MKRYAFVDYGGQVMGVETRCSCFLRSEKTEAGQLAVEDIIHPDLIYRYVEITDETGEAEIGMLFSDGRFIDAPAAPAKRLEELEAQMAALLGTEE